MKKLIPLLCLVGAVASADVKKAPPAAKPAADAPTAELSPDEQKKALYALGVMVAQRTPLSTLGLSDEDLKRVLVGLNDAVLGKELQVKPQDAKVDQLLREKQREQADAERTKGQTYLSDQAKAAGAQKLPSGLIYFETQAGSGASPTAADTVKVHYRGTLGNGTSHKRGQPAEFPLGGVIKCWTEGVQKMKVGGKARLVCPPDIAYGERGAPPSIPAGAVLNFEVELLEIKGK